MSGENIATPITERNRCPACGRWCLHVVGVCDYCHHIEPIPCPDCMCLYGTDGQEVVDGALVECPCKCHDLDRALSKMIGFAKASLWTPDTTYSGNRFCSERGEVWEVRRNGEPLRGDLFSRDILTQWGTDDGVLRPGATLLAWILCVDALGEDGPRADRIKHIFADRVVAELPDFWSLRRFDILTHIHLIEKGLQND